MLLHYFVALLAWSSVSASKYCMPSEYEINEGGTGILTTGFLSSVCRVSFDFNKGFTNSDCRNGVTYSTHMRTIEDFNAKKTYIIDVKKGTCMQLPRLEGPSQCIQGDKIVLDSYFGNGTLPFTSLSAAIRGVPVYFTVTSGSNGTFIPIGTTIANQGIYKLFNIGYYGYSDGVKDPSVFTIPPACYKTAQSEQEDEFHQKKKPRKEIEEFNKIRFSF